jgi:hypothetical protein
MKLFKPITLLFFLFIASYSYAAVTVDPVPVSRLQINKIRINDIEKLTGKKLTFFQKIRFKILQKTLGNFKGGEITEKQKKQAQVSMILGISSLALILLSLTPIAFIGILSIPAAILAIIFGAKSLKGNSNSQGMVGVVTGGIAVGIITLFLILVIVFFSGFSVE